MMGTWSHQPFGNDAALDWVGGFADADHDMKYLERALDRVLEAGSEYLESSGAEEAIAAAEVLAKLVGGGTQRNEYTREIDEWIEIANVVPSPELLHKAVKALKRIMEGNSELRDLWAETDEISQWSSGLSDITAALSGRLEH